jgi:hypothetical protein
LWHNFNNPDIVNGTYRKLFQIDKHLKVDLTYEPAKNSKSALVFDKVGLKSVGNQLKIIAIFKVRNLTDYMLKTNSYITLDGRGNLIIRSKNESIADISVDKSGWLNPMEAFTVKSSDGSSVVQRYDNYIQYKQNQIND